MRVLIIGGTRYMGRLAVEQMLERGDDVTVFSAATRSPRGGIACATSPATVPISRTSAPSSRAARSTR